VAGARFWGKATRPAPGIHAEVVFRPPGRGYDRARQPAVSRKGIRMKKLLVLLILVAIGVTVARKVREA
jgi:hypothetical protein